MRSENDRPEGHGRGSAPTLALRMVLAMCAFLALAAPATAIENARASGDQLLFFYDARDGRVPFFSVANPAPEDPVDVEIAIYPESLNGRLGQTTQQIPALGNVVIDLTQVAEAVAVGNVGLAVVTPIRSASDTTPIVPAAPLVGTFTIANVPLRSGFGENPLGRRAVRANGTRAAVGAAVGSGGVAYEALAPSILTIPVYFNPQQLGPVENDGNRIVLAAFADQYGDRHDLVPRQHQAMASIADASGTLVADVPLDVSAVTRTDLQTLAGNTALNGSGKVFFEVDPADGSVVGLFSQSLGPFGAGQRMPAVFGEREEGATIENGGIAGDQLLFFFDARDGRVPFFTVANPSSESSVIVEIAVYPSSLDDRIDEATATLAPLGNLIVDLTQLGAGQAGGRVGLAVVTPVVSADEARPVVPLEPLVGGFTLANVPLDSGFGENPVGRLGVLASGARATPGQVVDGATIRYQRLTPDVLMVPVFYNPEQLAPARDDGNRVILAAFADQYGDRFELAPASTGAEATVFDPSGALLASAVVQIAGVTLTSVQEIGGDQLISRSGKIFFDVNAGRNNVFGLFSQSLGPFGAGQRMPSVNVDTSRFPQATPSTTATPTPTPTPANTPTPTPSATEVPPTPGPGPTSTPVPTATMAPTGTPPPAPTQAPTPTPAPAPTAAPTPTTAPTASPTPSPAPTASAAPTPSPSPSASPSPTPSPEPTATPDVVTYADVGPILVGACGGCHVSSSQGGFSFSGPGDLVGVPSNQSALPYISAGSPSGSYLWHKINGTQLSVGGTGDQMPIGGNLSGTDIDTIEQWILDGANP